MSSSDTSSLDFHSATEGDIKRIKMGGDGGNEASDNDVHFDDEEREKSRCTEKSSASSSREEEDAIWAKLPNGTNEIFSKAVGIFYMDRYESFIRNNWPFDVKRRNLCHPRALALAGLKFHSLEPAPSAECVVCHKILKNLVQNSNPWILHSELSPDCYFVQLGQRDEVDDYSMDEMMEMACRKLYNDAERKFNEKERALKRQLYLLKQRESTLGLQNDSQS